MPLIVEIEDAEDPRIEAYRNVRERDLTGRRGFLAEGTVVLDPLLAARRFRPVSLLVLRARLAGLRERLEQLEGEVPVFVADRAVFDAVAGFPVHRGVMAHGEAVDEANEDWEERLARIAESNGVVAVGCGLSNHDNVGALFRNAAAFGAGAVLLDAASCDPLYRKALRVSVGTVLTVPYRRGGTSEAIGETLARLGFRCLFLSPNGAMELGAVRGDRAHALFLGTEGEGFAPEFLRDRRTLRIAMAPGLDSLNVATAGAIALHHLYAARRRPA